MGLSNKQLKKVDQYLKRKGVEFWDVRYEFTDHIACTLEQKIAQGITFEEAFKEIEQDFSRNVLKKHQRQVRKELNKVLVKSYFKSLKDIVLSPLYVISFFVFGYIMVYVLNNFSSKISFVLGFSVVAILVVIYLLKIIFNYRFYGKSMLLNLSLIHI